MRTAQERVSCGRRHVEIDFDAVVAAVAGLVSSTDSNVAVAGLASSTGSNVAMQNLQARLRMVLAYFCAQRTGTRTMLVLGTANVSETLRGYFTKYDCSSADINPLGSFSKEQIRQLVAHMQQQQPQLHTVLGTILAAVPSAELTAAPQVDEHDMGMTYAELERFGTLRAVARCGPLSMYSKLQREWEVRGLTRRRIAEKVKHFFQSYAENRHKTFALPPAFHASRLNAEDHRHDPRPLLYARGWTWQFRCIDQSVEEASSRDEASSRGEASSRDK